ncbi:nitroreductase family protein [Paenibacillus zanthoxyli]|uniref:hypothetical protein n=1 Tax=Paenibacillus zanthoxyli TaxID=369399 RepID=UPI00046F9216|nr:hypothetical protein [Paenibacillus zanthoxyli]
MSKGYKITRIIILSVVLLLALLVLAVFTTSGAQKKAEYLDPWKRDYAKQFEDPRLQLVAHGLLAANSHNLQPWKIRLDRQNPLVFYLYTDNERLALKSDPLARQTLVSQGTFLEYMRIAGEQLGNPAEIALFPDGEYDEQHLSESMERKPVAKITLSKANPQNIPLYEFMFLPDTNRMAYRPDEVTPDQIRKLSATDTEQDLTLTILNDKADIDRFGAFGVEGTVIETGLQRMNDESAEIFRSNEYQKNKYRFGFSFEGQGTTGWKKHLMQGLLTIIPSFNNEEAAAMRAVQAAQTAAGHTPAYALILSKDNSRTSQVKAGMLFSRLVLTAHEEGLVLQPISQVLQEYPEMHEAYSEVHREYAAAGETIQFLIRLGKPTQDTPLSMRQGVMDLISE